MVHPLAVSLFFWGGKLLIVVVWKAHGTNPSGKTQLPLNFQPIHKQTMHKDHLCPTQFNFTQQLWAANVVCHNGFWHEPSNDHNNITLAADRLQWAWKPQLFFCSICQTKQFYGCTNWARTSALNKKRHSLFHSSHWCLHYKYQRRLEVFFSCWQVLHTSGLTHFIQNRFACVKGLCHTHVILHGSILSEELYHL